MTKKTKTESKNTFEYQKAPVTAEDTALNAEMTAADTADPGIGYSFANQNKMLDSHIDNTFGADYSAETAAAMRYTGREELAQQQGQAMAQDAFNRKQSRWGKLIGLRQIRDPKLVQTGGTQTTKENGADFWNGLISGAWKGASQLAAGGA